MGLGADNQWSDVLFKVVRGVVILGEGEVREDTEGCAHIWKILLVLRMILEITIPCVN